MKKMLVDLAVVVVLFAAMILPTYYLAFNKGFEAAREKLLEMNYPKQTTTTPRLRKSLPPVHSNDEMVANEPDTSEQK